MSQTKPGSEPTTAVWEMFSVSGDNVLPPHLHDLRDMTRREALDGIGKARQDWHDTFGREIAQLADEFECMISHTNPTLHGRDFVARHFHNRFHADIREAAEIEAEFRLSQHLCELETLEHLLRRSEADAVARRRREIC